MIFNETYKTAALSTSHITFTDTMTLEKIAKEDCSMVAVRPTGYFIKLYSQDSAPEDNVRAELSPALNQILIEAHKQGFQCIEFDRDANEIYGAVMFDW